MHADMQSTSLAPRTVLAMQGHLMNPLRRMTNCMQQSSCQPALGKLSKFTCRDKPTSRFIRILIHSSVYLEDGLYDSSLSAIPVCLHLDMLLWYAWSFAASLDVYTVFVVVPFFADLSMHSFIRLLLSFLFGLFFPEPLLPFCLSCVLSSHYSVFLSLPISVLPSFVVPCFPIVFRSSCMSCLLVYFI